MREEFRFELPIRIQSTSNMREHWAPKAKRAKEHRSIARILTLQALDELDVRGIKKVVVKFTRHGSRNLDSDNLAAAFKATRDGVADALAIDDGSELLQWFYAQEKAQGYWVTVEISISRA